MKNYITLTKEILKGPAYDIGDMTYGNINIVGKLKKLTIGKYCSIAGAVNLICWGHNTNWITTYPFSGLSEYWTEVKDIKGHPVIYDETVIGNDVWISNNVIIMGGVKIGDGSIIAAGSVVHKDVEPYSIVSSNPLKTLRYRFSKEDIEFLLKLKWWDWSEQKLRANLPYLCSDNIDKLKEIMKGEI